MGLRVINFEDLGLFPRFSSWVKIGGRQWIGSRSSIVYCIPVILEYQFGCNVNLQLAVEKTCNIPE